MNRLVAIALVLIACLLAWLLSSSPLPTGCSLLLASLFFFARWTPMRRSSLLTLCIASLMAIMQWYLFGTGRAFVLLSDLPWYFHLGIGLHWLCFLEAFRIRQGDEESPLPLLWISLAGSILLLWTGGSVEVYETSLWFAHSVAGAPLVLSLWAGIFRHRTMRWRRIATGAAAILALGQLISLFNMGADRLYLVVRGDEEESYLEDSGERGPRTRDGGGSDSSARELPSRANISFDEKIRFYLQVENGADFHRLVRRAVYVRTSTVSAFESNNRIRPVRVGEWAYDSDDGLADASTHIKDPLPGNTIDYAVLLNAEDADQIPLLAETHQLATDAVYEFADDWFQIAPYAGISWIRLRGQATFPASRESIRIDESGGKVDFSSDYMRLPLTDLTAKISQLTSTLTAGKRRSEIPEAIATFLRENCEYSLRYRNPRDLPPVENFLFDEKKGHCEMYAAAAVMMLRSVGIPARIAYGYSGGAADFGTRMFAFRDSDFHAWPEVYDTDEEWKIFDTTPLVAGSTGRNASRTKLEQVDMTRYEDVGRAELISEKDESFLSLALDAVLSWMSQHFLLLISGLTLAAVIYWSVKRRIQSRFGDDPGSGREGFSGIHSSNSGVPSFIKAIDELGESYGYRRESSQTLHEYVELLLATGVGSEILRQGVDYFYRIHYVGHEREPSLERNFLKQIRDLQ